MVEHTARETRTARLQAMSSSQDGLFLCRHLQSADNRHSIKGKRGALPPASAVSDCDMRAPPILDSARPCLLTAAVLHTGCSLGQTASLPANCFFHGREEICSARS